MIEIFNLIKIYFDHKYTAAAGKIIVKHLRRYCKFFQVYFI